MESRKGNFFNQRWILLDEIKGFIAAVYDKDWWLGCVIKVKEDENKVVVNLLIPHGPSQSFKYPVEERIVIAKYLLKIFLLKFSKNQLWMYLHYIKGRKQESYPAAYVLVKSFPPAKCLHNCALVNHVINLLFKLILTS